eukprot:3267019-Rhodomonas_salina.1
MQGFAVSQGVAQPSKRQADPLGDGFVGGDLVVAAADSDLDSVAEQLLGHRHHACHVRPPLLGPRGREEESLVRFRQLVHDLADVALEPLHLLSQFLPRQEEAWQLSQSKDKRKIGSLLRAKQSVARKRGVRTMSSM